MNNRLSRFLVSPYVAAFLIVLAYVMAVTATVRKSVTFDEVAGIIGGYSIWQKNDFRMLPENGSLHQRLAGLPSLWRNDQFPDTTQEAWRYSDLYTISEQLLYRLGNDAESLVLNARAMVALVIFPLGALIYFLSRSLFGSRGAFVSLILFAFCPSVLAHAPLVVSDTIFSFFCLLATVALWRLFGRVTWLNVLLAGLALAGVFLSKMSGVVILPVGLLLAIVRLCNPEPLPVQGMAEPVRGFFTKCGVFAMLVPLIGLIVWFGIWTVFDFRYSAFSPSDATPGRLFPGGWDSVLSTPGLARDTVTFLRDGQWFPESFLYGALMTAKTISTRQCFLNGEFGLHGFRSFFPYAFAVKETLPYLIILVLGLAAGVVAFFGLIKKSKEDAWAHVRRRLYLSAPFLILVVVYAVFAITSNLNIGHRHLFPLYPPLFVLAGAAGVWLTRRTAWMGAGVAVLLAWHVGESLAVRPNYLTYFNELAGGPSNGYRHLVDSSLDWGQDLPGLKDWLHERQLEDGRTPVYLLYFGTARADYYRIHVAQLPGFLDRVPHGPVEPLQPGVYAISATHFQGVYLEYCGPWTEHFEQVYRSQVLLVGEVMAAQNDVEALRRLNAGYSMSVLEEAIYQFPRLRVARLCAWLREHDRKPDALINNSILIFNLGADELHSALEEPLATTDS